MAILLLFGLAHVPYSMPCPASILALDSSRSSLLRGDPQFTRTSIVKSPLRVITVQPSLRESTDTSQPPLPCHTRPLHQYALDHPTDLRSRRLTSGEGHTFMLTYNHTFKRPRDRYDLEKTYVSRRVIFEEGIIKHCKPTTAYGCMRHSCYMILYTMGYGG